ncbi:hypothetical protein [Kibdelosporangium philippinense]|uniref:hypothetical protein n=1 Tax=Kibdelosporangium philippinense TaxID=211113 RepID=UPI00361B44EC
MSTSELAEASAPGVTRISLVSPGIRVSRGIVHYGAPRGSYPSNTCSPSAKVIPGLAKTSPSAQGLTGIRNDRATHPTVYSTVVGQPSRTCGVQ